MTNLPPVARRSSPRGSSKCPTIDELSQALDPNASAKTHVDHHLDTCHECREVLCYLAGEQQWWEAAASILSTPSPDKHMAPTICAMSTAESSTPNDDPLCEHELKQLQTLLEPASHPELIGRIGRYELEQLVGRGGMGLVFRARDVELQRVVAVKTLAIHLIPIGAARQRFVREARATASLTHPHIVPVYDVITEGAVPAIVMQFITGPTLEQQLSADGPMAWQEVLQIGIQLADALATAHKDGLVHRDIKPGNVLLEAGGTRALLTDFGLVRALDDATLTRSGMLAGTPDYMSPEQANGQTVSASSDLFSLGSVLYAMLTGHPPFRAESPMAVMNRLCHQRHRSIHELRADVPLEVNQVIDRLLNKLPRRRFASAADVAQRLRELAVARQSLRKKSMRAVVPLLATAALIIALGLNVGLRHHWVLSEFGKLFGVLDREQQEPLLGKVDLTADQNGRDELALSANNLSSEGSLETSGMGSSSGFVELQMLENQIVQLRSEVDSISSVDEFSDEIGIEHDQRVDPLDDKLENLQVDLEALLQDLRSPF